MGLKSRRKGQKGEREAAAAIRNAIGIECRRGQQFKGGSDSPDIATDSPLHFEIKRLRRIAILAALRQAESESAADRLPLALVREDGDTEWVAIVRLARLPELARIIRK